MKKILFVVLVGAFILSGLPLLEVAAQSVPDPIITDMGGVEGLLSFLVGWMWRLASIVVIMFLLYAGFLFVTAAGNDDQVNKAKGILKWAVIGIVVMILASSVMVVLENFIKQAS